MHSQGARRGSMILVVGDAAVRAKVFMEAVALSPHHKPSLLFSTYPGSTSLLLEASRSLDVEDLLELVLISIVVAEAPRLLNLVNSLSPAMKEGQISVVGFDTVFTPALKQAGRDLDERARIASALSMLRALARRGGACVLIMEAEPPPRLVVRHVDATWPQAASTRLVS